MCLVFFDADPDPSPWALKNIFLPNKYFSFPTSYKLNNCMFQMEYKLTQMFFDHLFFAVQIKLLLCPINVFAYLGVNISK